jgi:hypothetical protein|tara:strand:- start:4859 stop:6904 length:2046 start_codon:yes stop_codon:yes gene_type:complete
MANRIPTDERAKEMQEVFKNWSDSRKKWDTQAREDVDFYLGNHWTKEETESLNSINQSNVVADRLYSAIEQFKAIITSKPPSFRAYPREDSDTQLASVWNGLLEYIWDISDGNEVFKQVVHDYAVTGLGYFYAYTDAEADYGRGEVKFTWVDPFRVYVSPNARHRYFDDSDGMILSTIYSKRQLLNQYQELTDIPEGFDKPMIEYIDKGLQWEDEDYPSSDMNTSISNAFTPDVIKDSEWGNAGKEKYRVMSHFDKIKVPYFRLIDKREKPPKEVILEHDKFKDMIEKNPEMEVAINLGQIEYVEVMQTRVRETCCVGQIILYQKILNTDIFPIVPAPNIWTNTPYPMSDVRKGKDMQRFLNKMHSLLTAHAQSSAGLKLLIPQGSVQDIEQLEKDWANPNATIEYDASFGEPHFPSPQPISQSILHLPQQAERYIDLNMGIYEMQQGNAEQAPRTASATMQLEDFGQRRSKSKLRDIEGSLKRLGKVVYNLAKKHYDYQKTFSIVNANNNLTDYTVNKKLYDDKTGAIASREQQLQVGDYDIRIVGNSTMPSNKWAEWQIYMEAFQMGLIDRTEALKKTEVFDKEGVLQRMDEIAQMQQQLQQQESQIKDLSGDLQTARREAVSARQRTEVEKYKAELEGLKSQTKADTKVAVSKMNEVVKSEGQIAKQQAKGKAQKETS